MQNGDWRLRDESRLWTLSEADMVRFTQRWDARPEPKREFVAWLVEQVSTETEEAAHGDAQG